MLLGMKFFQRRTAILMAAAMVAFAGVAILKSKNRPTSKPLSYKGKPVELWFYDSRIFEALIRLEPYLSQHQKDRFHQVISERPVVPFSPQ